MMADIKNEGLAVTSSPEMSIIKTPVQGNTYDVFLQEGIDDLKHFVTLFDILDKASDKDIVTLHMNCHGGNVATGLQLIHHMRKSKAHVKAIAEAPLYSMGPIVAMAADELELAQHVFFMFHDYKTGIKGSGNEITKHATAFNVLVKGVFEDIFGSLLTKVEIDKILDGSDFYLTADEVKTRLKKRKK